MKLAAFGLLALGCVVNGKAYGPGAQSPSSSSPASSPASSSAGAPSGHQTAGYGPAAPAPADGHYAKYPPYPTAPADPWAGVAGDQPLRWSEDDARYWTVRGNSHDCTAANDHCLNPHVWFLVREDYIQRGGQVPGSAHIFGPNGPTSPSNARNAAKGFENTLAFRTVPATKRNIKPGVIVFGLARPGTHFDNGVAAHEATWLYGIVEEVDFDIGTYRLKGYDDSWLLPGARVAVLTWKPGGKVEILDGKKKHELAVRRDEVFLPPGK